MHALKKFHICICIARIIATCNCITTTRVGASEALGKIRVSTDVDNTLVSAMATLETEHGMEGIRNGEMERSLNTGASTMQERSWSGNSKTSVDAVTVGMNSTDTSGTIAQNTQSGGTIDTKWQPELIESKSSFQSDALSSPNEISTARTPVVPSHITEPNSASGIRQIPITDAAFKPTIYVVDEGRRNNMTMPVCLLSLRVSTNGLSFLHSRQNCTATRSAIPEKVFMAPSLLLNNTDTCVPGDEQVIGATHGYCSAQSASLEGLIDRWVCLRNETMGVIRICPIPSGAEVEGSTSEYVINTCGLEQDSIKYMKLFVTAKVDECLIHGRGNVQFKRNIHHALEYSVLAVATTGITLSVMLIIVFIGQLRSKLSSGNVYFLSLAMADLGHLLVLVIKFTMSLVKYRSPDIIILFELSTRFYCMLMVLAVTIDRYIAVVYPLKTVLITWQRTIKVKHFLSPFHAETTFVHGRKMQKVLKTTYNLLFWYSRESSHRVLTDEYPYAMV